MHKKYYDLMFMKCQKSGAYHMFTFDIENSKKMNQEDLVIAERKLRTIIIDLYNYLLFLEEEYKIKIVLEKELYEDEPGLMSDEPIIFGDMVAITIYRNSISDESFYRLFNIFREKHHFDYNLHINDGYYQTVKWIEGSEKYARSYCANYLSNAHKLTKKIK